MKLLVFGAVLFTTSVAASTHRAPVLDVGVSTDGYHGTIREDKRKVNILPELRVIADSGPVCSYELVTDTTNASDAPLPFAVKLIDEQTGAADLIVKDDARLDCHTAEHKFRIVARPCDTNREPSESVSVTVTVEDTNDHVPEFLEPWYTAAVDEGRLYDNIIQLNAVDGDCNARFSEICRYEIVSSGQGDDAKFTITQQGIVRNTAPLSYANSRSHILSVVAHDCGMRKSKPTLLTIEVRESCNLELKGVSDRVNYYPGAGSQWLAPKASVSLCDDTCDVHEAEAKVTLSAEHIAKGCDREVYASMQARKSCNVDKDTIDLLPRLENVEGKQAKSIKTNNVVEQSQDEESYYFDGKRNAIIVSDDVVPHSTPHKFTLSFWMRHEAAEKGTGHKKENIICTTDDHHLNRHHFSVYVRNCKLQMVVRTEPNEGKNKDEYYPAEWRWTMEQVCDNQWHHYSIDFENPNATLHVDGHLFEEREGNPEVLDDVPLHKLKDAVKPRMVIGACWHARTNQMKQFFTGYLSSMLYLTGKQEKAGVLSCLHQCKEQLQFHGLKKLVSGEEAIFNTELSELTLRASKTEDLAKMLQKVAYVNSRQHPTPGHRGFKIDTTVTCSNKKESIHLNSFNGYIFVQQAPEPKLIISSADIIKTTDSAVQSGTLMLPDLHVEVTQPDQDGHEHETTAKHKLDWCNVHLDPPRTDKQSEYFSSPAALIGQLRLDFEHDDLGIVVKGIESVEGYQSVLTEIRYHSYQPEMYRERKYTVQCSMLNGRVLSNKLDVKMLIEPDPKVESNKSDKKQQQTNVDDTIDIGVVEPILKPRHHNYRLESVLEMDLPGPRSILSHDNYGSTNRSFAGGVVALVVVVCVGLLLVLLVVGVVRMRNPRVTRFGRKYRKQETDLAWDDGALNITVNPLETGEPAEEAETSLDHPEEFSDDSSDEGEGFHFHDGDELSEDDDDDVSDDNEETVLPHVANGRTNGSTGLEWDDSTLNSPGIRHSASCSRSYRV